MKLIKTMNGAKSVRLVKSEDNTRTYGMVGRVEHIVDITCIGIIPPWIKWIFVASGEPDDIIGGDTRRECLNNAMCFGYIRS